MFLAWVRIQVPGDATSVIRSRDADRCDVLCNWSTGNSFPSGSSKKFARSSYAMGGHRWRRRGPQTTETLAGRILGRNPPKARDFERAQAKDLLSCKKPGHYLAHTKSKRSDVLTVPDCISQLRIRFRHLTLSRKGDAIVFDAERASLDPSEH
jgi:hypothetical protein